MKVLVVGSGAREHALGWKLKQSKRVSKLMFAPGNPGMQSLGECIDVKLADIAGLVALAKATHVDLVVVGPEQPLVLGIVDALSDAGIAAFGPSRSAARLEGSKVFAKEFMRAHGIPTAAFEVFDDADKADAYVRGRNCPLVVKADGLAAGKGVVVAKNATEALVAIDAMLRKRQFGTASEKVIIEECLNGEEVSYHVVCDGIRGLPFVPAQDHKRLLNHDRGPNTGGMGAYSPPPIFTKELEQKVLSRIVEPTLEAMAKAGTPFCGALFVGLMIVDGEPWALEYNVRFGDPETEVMMMRFGGDIAEVLVAAAKGDISAVSAKWSEPAALCVVLASEGYPERPKTGDTIDLGENLESDILRVFHAGTRVEDGVLKTNGGRVLTVTAAGASILEAQKRAQTAIGGLHFRGMQYRTDIGARAFQKGIS